MEGYGTLYICATPIGNLEDITFRALETLRSVDLVAAEDTRHTLKLLNHFGIKKPMISYYEHNRRERGEVITARLKAGENVALVSDAGTPAISDPGEELVAQCVAEGIRVVPLPGASAVVTALCCAGLPTGRFSFQGFLTVNKRKRREHLEGVRDYPETLVFYEAPHKLKSTLKDMLDCFGDRPMALCRELTKAHEEVIRCTLAQAAQRYADEAAKGEFVLLISGAPVREAALSTEDVADIYRRHIEDGMDEKEAIKAAAKEAGLHKREVYARVKIK